VGVDLPEEGVGVGHGGAVVGAAGRFEHGDGVDAGGVDLVQLHVGPTAQLEELTADLAVDVVGTEDLEAVVDEVRRLAGHHAIERPGGGTGEPAGGHRGDVGLDVGDGPQLFEEAGGGGVVVGDAFGRDVPAARGLLAGAGRPRRAPGAGRP